MRLFLAIQLSPAVREALLTAQDALRRQGRGSFPPPENLHLTLAFLGEAEDPARARAALSEVSFNIHIIISKLQGTRLNL